MTDRATRRRMEREAKKQQRSASKGEESITVYADQFIHLANNMMMQGHYSDAVLNGMMFGTARFMANFANMEAMDTSAPRAALTESLLTSFIKMYQHHSTQFAIGDGQHKAQAPVEPETHPIDRPKGIWDTQEHILSKMTDAVSSLHNSYPAYLRGRGLLAEAERLESDWIAHPTMAERLKAFCQNVDSQLKEGIIPSELCVYVLLQSLTPMLLEIIPGAYVPNLAMDKQSLDTHLKVCSEFGLNTLADRLRQDPNAVMTESNKGMEILFGKLAVEFHNAFNLFQRTQKPS